MAELFRQIQEVFLNLFNSEALMATLGQPEITLAAFIALNLIIFTETGLLIGFFFPGDSLLITAGIVAYASGWDLPLLMATLCASAIVGDSVGYLIGYRTGPKLFNKEKSFFFRKDYLLYAENFYERHGGKTIIIARFIPILRTFAPVVAGIGRMHYRRFLFFNVFGGIGWDCSMLLVGFYLTPVLDPLLKPVFGESFQVQRHIEIVIIIVILLSVSPGIYAGARELLRRRAARRAAPAGKAA
ncbi:MAG TPA: VTT domain-containing protein [Gemmataceae bacterium]